MPNLQNPKFFVITPGAAVDGAPVDDYTISYAAAPNNTPPDGFPTGAPQVLVPAADLVPQSDGTIRVPLPDIVASTLAVGTYCAEAAANSSAAVNSGKVDTESAFSTPPTFFDITAPVPNAPALSVA